MERFLSRAWFARFAVDEPPGGTPEVVLQQVVTGTPDGEVRYQVTVADGRATIREGSRAEADMTFTSDYDTATAIARGALSTEAALAAGRIRVAGDLSRLEDHASAIAGLDAVGNPGRAATGFDGSGHG